MNRRKVIARFAGIAFVPANVLAREESTPEPSPYSPLFSPNAISVTFTSFRRDRTDTTDVVRVPYFLFEFDNEDDAAENFENVMSQIDDARETDEDHLNNWHDEISIGDIGNDRIGYIQEEDKRIYGLVVKDEYVVYFTVVAPDPVGAYVETIQSVFENAESLDLTLSDFPAGWRYEIEPVDATDVFTN